MATSDQQKKDVCIKQSCAIKMIISGQVQGVGFRPFIFHHAINHNLSGWVRNITGRVEIHIQGILKDIKKFQTSLIQSSPSISKPVIEQVNTVELLDTVKFIILESLADKNSDIHFPTDLFTCPDCVDELNDPDNRRYQYPFINCTQCGPRYTIIRALPYDRKNTSMFDFKLCPDCAKEYSDVNDRRYHAEPIACEICGPSLTYKKNKNKINNTTQALNDCIKALKAGKVVAIKGIGGYHLVCDAKNDKAILHLRHNKPRADKPLAVMLSEGDIKKYADLTETEYNLLSSAARPIVLTNNINKKLSPHIAPGIYRLGLMLPYSPLHHILLKNFASPLVFTSANISGEPVLIDNKEVEKRLSHVAYSFLHHNRPIVRPADDSVFQVIDAKPRPVRLGRGFAPLEIELPFELEKPLLAVGCHMKNTVAIGWKNRLVLSPHIGEMDNVRSLQTFENCIVDLQSIYQVTTEHIVYDAHEGYTASRWAMNQQLPSTPVYHHHSHASACWFEASLKNTELNQLMVFTWDGIGLGSDGNLWGGDLLLGRPGSWNRVSSFRPFKLPGGEFAGRQPWRSAAAVCWENDLPYEMAKTVEHSDILYNFWKQGKNSPQTTSVGRLFDAAAALIGLCTEASYEGQGPMMLEAISDDFYLPLEMKISEVNKQLIVDWSNLIPMLKNKALTQSQRAACFHTSMANSLLLQALRIRKKTGVNTIGLSGGVFQNKLLTELSVKRLNENNFEVILPEIIPVNDAGISVGQIIEYGLGRYKNDK